MGIYNFDPDDAFRFAKEQGIRANTRGNELQFRKCPYCKNNTDDKNTFAINLKTGQFKCLRATCGAHGNMITLAKDFGFSLGTEADEYYRPQKRFRDLANYPRPDVRPGAIKYLEGRGISKETAKRYSITTQKDKDSILVFPFFDESGSMQFVKYRNTEFQKGSGGNKEWCEAKCKPVLFGMDRCDTDNDTLVLTEGQIDSLSVSECGIENAVSVPTGANGFTWVPYCWDFLAKFKTLIVFGDYENGHITLLEEMKKRFVGTVKHVRPEDYLDCKDANELLLKHGREAVINAVANAEPVKNDKIKDLYDAERKDISKLEKVGTGISALNRVLVGFYFGQLIILTGERGSGKSTLGSQFCIWAIQEGYNVFLYSGEMLEWNVREWIDRQVAGPQYINKIVSKHGGEVYTVDQNYIDAISEWYRGKCFIYDNGIIDDGTEEESLAETIEVAIKQYGCRVLMVDNLMTAMEDDMASDIYRLQTAFVRKLSLIAKKYNVLMFLVVHPRKVPGSGERRNDDVSGSSNITNLADVVMWYEKNTENEECDSYLRITKNRMTGKLTKKSGIQIWFDAASKRISDRSVFSWKLGWEASAADSQNDFKSVDDFDTEIPF